VLAAGSAEADPEDSGKNREAIFLGRAGLVGGDPRLRRSRQFGLLVFSRRASFHPAKSFSQREIPKKFVDADPPSQPSPLRRR